MAKRRELYNIFLLGISKNIKIYLENKTKQNLNREVKTWAQLGKETSFLRLKEVQRRSIHRVMLNLLGIYKSLLPCFTLRISQCLRRSNSKVEPAFKSVNSWEVFTIPIISLLDWCSLILLFFIKKGIKHGKALIRVWIGGNLRK